MPPLPAFDGALAVRNALHSLLADEVGGSPSVWSRRRTALRRHVSEEPRRGAVRDVEPRPTSAATAPDRPWAPAPDTRPAHGLPLQHGNRIDGADRIRGRTPDHDEQERHEHPDHSEAEDQIAQSPLGPVIAHDPIPTGMDRSARPPGARHSTNLTLRHGVTGSAGPSTGAEGSGGRARLTGSDAPITVSSQRHPTGGDRPELVAPGV